MARAILLLLYFLALYFLYQFSFVDTVPNPFGSPTPEQEAILDKLQWHPWP